MIRIHSSKGFTLIELIVAFSIISIISVVGFASFVTYSRTQAIDNEANQLVSTLNLAKAKAQSQVKPSDCSSNDILKEYRVNISNNDNSYRLYVVCVQAGGIDLKVDVPIEGTSNILHSFPSPISVNTSTADISYNVLSGGITPATITLTGAWVGQNMTRTITIQNDGNISVTSP